MSLALPLAEQRKDYLVDLMNESIALFEEWKKGNIIPGRAFFRVKWILISMCFTHLWSVESKDNVW